MRRRSRRVSIGLVVLTIGAAPGPDGAIVDYHRPPPTFGQASDERHHLRGGLVRIDQQIVVEPAKTVLLRQRYTRPGQKFVFETTRTTDGRLVGVFAMDDRLSSPPAATLRRPAGSTETHLGERCRVWQVTTPTERGDPFRRSGCTTDDGIELWRKQANIDAIAATRIRRTAVPPAAVRLPIEALDTAALMRAEAGTDHRHDYEAVLQGSAGESASYRRSGDWRYVSNTTPGGVDIAIRNDRTGVVITYSRDGSGTRRLGWSSPPLAAGTPDSGLPGVALPEAGAQTVLGERCTMRNVMPGVSDAGRVDCLTADGIPLLITRTAWSSARTLTATRLSRRPQPLATVMLPPALNRPAAWPLR